VSVQAVALTPGIADHLSRVRRRLKASLILVSWSSRTQYYPEDIDTAYFIRVNMGF
jgi:hypothetical protein